jgi:hypothetical protein
VGSSGLEHILSLLQRKGGARSNNLKNGHSDIDGYRIETVTSEFNSANVLRMTVGTNCPRDGDAEHGGRTVITLDARWRQHGDALHSAPRHG